MRVKSLLAVLLLAGLAFPAQAAELYGKPLRGLTPIAIAELNRNAGGYDGKTIQVRGTVRSEDGAFLLAEGAAFVRVTMSGSSAALPSDAAGATATAEGVFRAKGAGGGPALEATGLELTR